MIFFLSIIFYIFVGILAGIASGLFGIGGGVITVPALLLIFSLQKFPQAYIMHLAIGTSLAAMTFNTISGTYSHNKRHAVKWDLVKRMLPGIIIGSTAGAIVADYFSSIILQVIFGIFAICLGVYLILPKKRSMNSHSLPNFFILFLISTGIGAIANILGIGGGVITVPIFLAFRIPEIKAIGSSVATTLFICFIGALSYLFFGLNEPIDYPAIIGFIYLPAFFVIGLSTFFSAPYGVKLAHKLPAPLLRKFFGMAMAIVGLAMLFS